MTATALGKVAGFYSTTVGKKVVMALTGVVMFGFLIGHVLGNVQAFAGAEKIDAYSKFLHDSPPLLWGTRILLLVSVFFHAQAAIQLYTLRARARPVGYAKKRHRGANAAALSMLVTGVLVLLFVVYHILHFTTGTLHASFVHGRVFDNMAAAFRNPAVALVYLAAMVVLALHLYHGLWSLSQSIGVTHPTTNARIRKLAAIASIALAALFATVPIAFLAGAI